MKRTMLVAVVAMLAGTVASVTNAPAEALTSSGLGIASRDPDISDADAGRLARAGASWTYAWRYRKIPAAGTAGIDVVPMIRTRQALTPSAVQTLSAAKASGKYTELLGFNEPDNPHQSNLTPKQAADLWPQLESTGLMLGTPAPAVPHNGWLYSFMSIAKQRGLRVDFIALHFYANINDTHAVERVRRSTAAIHKRYPKLPIWITELGVTDRHPNSAPASVKWAKSIRFMKGVTAALKKQPYVVRYGWVDDTSINYAHLKWSALVTAGGASTPLGKAFLKLAR